jgi:tripartite-type tricarboxylate transporter receptor subunit TctC
LPKITSIAVWRSDPDGMTFLYHLTNVMVSHQVLGGADFDIREMAPLGRLTTLANGLIVRKDLELPERSLTGLIERSAELPVLLGNISDPVEVELFVRLLAAGGLDFQVEVVQLDSTSDIIASLLRDEIEVGKTTSVGAIPGVEDNPDELEFLVTLGCERETPLPDIPSIAEEDIAGVELICESFGAAHRVFLGPPSMSSAHATQLTAALEAAVADPEFREQLEASGAEPNWASPDELSSLLANLVETWAEHSEGIGR